MGDELDSQGLAHPRLLTNGGADGAGACCAGGPGALVGGACGRAAADSLSRAIHVRARAGPDCRARCGAAPLPAADAASHPRMCPPYVCVRPRGPPSVCASQPRAWLPCLRTVHHRQPCRGDAAARGLEPARSSPRPLPAPRASQPWTTRTIGLRRCCGSCSPGRTRGRAQQWRQPQWKPLETQVAENKTVGGGAQSARS